MEDDIPVEDLIPSIDQSQAYRGHDTYPLCELEIVA